MTSPAPISVTIQRAKTLVEYIVRAGLVAMIKGSPGIGKSAIVKAIAKDHNLKMIDLRLAQCDPTDLLGFPHINTEGTKASYVPMNTFPIEGDKIPNGYDGWLLFLDEMNAADRGVQKAAYKLILDRQIGEFNLHKKVAIVAAGNLDTDNAIVEELSTALQSRLIHITVKSDADSWLVWALKAGIDHRILSFIRFKPGNLNTFNPDNDDGQDTYACERTWEFAHQLLSTKIETEDPDLLPLLNGTLSEGISREFISFLRIYKDLPTMKEILTNPKNIEIPDQPSTLYALTGSIGHHAKEETIDKLFDFIDRMPMEFQVICMREIGRRNNELLSTPRVEKWIATNNTELF